MKRTTLGVSVAAMVLAAVVLWRSQSTPEQVRPRPTVKATTAPLVGPAAKHDCALQVGQRFALAVEVESNVVVKANAERPTRATLAALLELEVVKATAGASVVRGKLDRLDDRVPGAATQGLGRPFLLDLDSSCELRRFARHTTVARDVARRQQGLVWAAQFRVVSQPTFFQGQDVSGEYEAVLTPLDRGAHIEKRVERYKRLWVNGGSEPTTTTSLRVALGNGWLAAATLKEQLENSDSTTTSQLLMRTAPPSGSFEPFVETDFVWGNQLPLDETSATLVHTPLAPELLGAVANQTATQAVQAFEQRLVEQGVQSAWPPLAAFLQTHPEEIRPMLKRVEAGELLPAAGGLFFTALGQVPGDEARVVLLEVKRNEGAALLNRIRAMVALVHRPDVGAPLAREFMSDAQALTSSNEVREQFGREAVLGLSILSGLRNDPELKGLTREMVTSLLQEPQTRGLAMTAIGNSADPTLLPLVEPLTVDLDTEVRAAAVRALRRMPPTSTEAMGLAWLRREDSAHVKGLLWDTLFAQHLDAKVQPSRDMVAQLVSDFPKTKSLITRRMMVRFLGRADLKEPSLRATLVAMAKQERSQPNVDALNEFASILTPDEIAEVLR